MPAVRATAVLVPSGVGAGDTLHDYFEAVSEVCTDDTA